MKKILTCLLAIFLIMPFLTACSDKNTQIENDKLTIVVTTFPQYDWVKQILGEQIEKVELILLIKSGVDLHNFQPSTEDIAKINACDMFIYIGGESDNWVNAILKNVSSNTVIIKLIDVIEDRAKEEELVEGMQQATEQSHTHDDLDEHVWLSLKNARVICNYLAVELGKLDVDHADDYRANVSEYTAKLNELDEEYQAVVDDAVFNTLLFGDRFPFRYLVDDYDLDYYAAFSGCSAETEASFETIVFLVNKLDELSLTSIVVIEGSNQALAKTIAENSRDKNQTILVLDSMQAVTDKNIEAGTTYLSIMKSNLEVLKQALN